MALVIKYRIRLIERVLIIIVRAVPVTTIRIIIIERILVASEYKEGGKDRYYRLY